MSHVEIKCFSGRTEEQKKECAERVAEVIAETLGCKTTSVSVAIKDIPDENWFPVKEDVNDEVVMISKDVADIIRKHVSAICEEI